MNRSDLREELARLILGEEQCLTGSEVTDKGGLTVEQGERLWRALGFPNAGDAPAYGDRDVEAIALIAATLEGGLLDESTVFRLTRALGQTMAKLADWQVATIVDQVEADVAHGRARSRLEAAVTVAQQAGPDFEALLLYAWRRHLAAAAARLEALGAVDAELLSTTMTVGFADLSRFTAMSNTIDQASLGALVEEFENRCTDVVTAYGGRVIKALGDAVLFVNRDPAAGVSTALEVVQNIGARESLPDVRVALATGSVVSRLGDVFGPPVNLAARLSHVARSNRVLVDEATAAGLGDGEFEMRSLPARPLRGFGNVSPITVSRRRGFRPRRQGPPHHVP
ncbi:adenylate/guanylate cyclase domain-containing protein [Aeromicrobium sp. CF4.19]|uniref:adenylate/guanylate cyclase domain-containing protein n=1 Tax=Aeromicrobium sp. CF4.19 TaxID=3373082 RepID=UPI003EE7AD3C